MEEQAQKTKSWFDKYYKIMFLIPIVLVIISLVYLSMFYSKHNDLIYKDVSLSGGTTITLTGNFDFQELETELNKKFAGISFRELTGFSDSQKSLVIESSASPGELKPEIEKILNTNLTDENSSIEFSGPSLSTNFYRQLLTALIISFILMSIVIVIMFRTFVPSLAVIFAAFSDIVIPLAILNLFEVKISAAGIAAFLMLIGYSVDTDILLTTRALRGGEGHLNQRIFRAFKTGILMTLTALTAVIPAFFIGSALPDSFRQIFLILALGLSADIINTWLTNAGIIKWYCDRKGIK